MQKIKTYPSGLRIICDEMSGFGTVATYVYVCTGAINEDETNIGISHLIEHMFFKGTKTRSAFKLADDFKNIGAQNNAFTSREETVFYTKSIAENTEKCLEILSDMYFNSVFDEKELAKEKKVVIEEIKMGLDDPANICYNLIDENFYKNSPYSRNIIGTRKSVLSITREQILDYISKNYTAEKTIISFAGKITMEEAEKLVEKYFAPFMVGTGTPYVQKAIADIYPEKPIGLTKYKDNEQSEVCITYRMPNRYTEFDAPASILNTIWGGGSMSNRLFQRIREKLGLVYRIYSASCMHLYGGDMSISFASSTKNIPFALKEIKKEIKKLLKKKVSVDEFEKARDYTYASLIMRYENTSFVALSNAKDLFNFGKLETREDIVARLKQTTIHQVNELIDYIYDNENYVIACVGRDKKINLLKEYNSK